MEGTMPVPVAARMAGSALCKSHSMVSPSVFLPSSRVSWKIRAAQIADRRTLRSLPFTLMWRSLFIPPVERLLFLTIEGPSLTEKDSYSLSTTLMLFTEPIEFMVLIIQY
ncbi:hypothetical protein V8G54_025616 [Vigna mungo]|uniref:Uncharacterized protein n=1 Tax=Vigna mungo TaxID=3915 RepID=A0AAQ3MYL1_VIGMU